MTTLFGMIIIGSMIGTIVLAIIQLYNPEMRRRTSLVAIVGMSLASLSLIGSFSTEEENQERTDSLVSIHYEFAGNVYDLLNCYANTYDSCTYELRLVTDHLRKLAD